MCPSERLQAGQGRRPQGRIRAILTAVSVRAGPDLRTRCASLWHSPPHRRRPLAGQLGEREEAVTDSGRRKVSGRRATASRSPCRCILAGGPCRPLGRPTWRHLACSSSHRARRSPPTWQHATCSPGAELRVRRPCSMALHDAMASLGKGSSHRAGSGRPRPLSRCLPDQAFGPGWPSPSTLARPRPTCAAPAMARRARATARWLGEVR